MGHIPNLIWRSGLAYFRADIPLDLRGHSAFGNKREEKTSLRTRDRSEASRLVGRKRLEFDDLCQRLRAERDAETSPKIVQAKKDAPWQAYREASPDSTDSIDRFTAALGSRHAAKAIGEGSLNRLEVAVTDTQGAVGGRLWLSYFRFDPAVEDVVEESVLLPVDYSDAVIDAVRQQIARDRARLAPLDLNGSSRGDGQSDINPTLWQVLERWQKERKPSPGTVGNYKSTLRLLDNTLGRVKIVDLTAQDCITFKNSIVDSGAKGKTIQRHLSSLRTLCAYAEQNALCTKNVAENLKAEARDDSDERLHFSEPELAALFTNERRGSAHWWIMAVALTTGMRLDEICQLMRSDVRQEEGVWYFFVSRASGRRAKNRSSFRCVPLPKVLLEAGFLKTVPQDGRLFASIRETPGRSAQKNFTRWFGKYRASLGIEREEGTRKDFHSFRHTFIGRARIDIPEEWYVRITGHNGGNGSRVNCSYGPYELPTLKRFIDTLEWPALKAAH